MKPTTFFLGLLNFLVFLIIIPLTLIKINNYYELFLINFLLVKSLGFICFIASIFLIMPSFYLFDKYGQGTPAPIDPPKKFVVRGLYLKTRNPMYIGYILLFLAEFLIAGHILLLIYSLIMVIFIDQYVKKIEEPKLEKRFGQKYLNYRKQVPRWV